MSRLIDADELLTAFPVDDEPMLTKSCVYMTIRRMPSVDAVPVVHGRWIHGQEVCREYIGITLIMVQYSHWECSVCGYRTEDKPLWKYCPNCGARMDGKDGEQL